MGGGQQPADPIQGVACASPVPERLVLDAAAHLIQPFVGEADHVKRVGDLAGAGITLL